MDSLITAVEKTVGAEIALIIAAVGACFVLFFQFVKQTKEYGESPRLRRLLGYGQLVGGLGLSEGAIAIAWYSWVASRHERIDGWLIWMPLIPLVLALVIAALLLWAHRSDPNRTASDRKSTRLNSSHWE